MGTRGRCPKAVTIARPSVKLTRQWLAPGTSVDHDQASGARTNMSATPQLGAPTRQPAPQTRCSSQEQRLQHTVLLD